MPDWLIGLAVAALLVPGAAYLVWDPAKITREWRIAVRKRTKYDYTRVTLWWSFNGPKVGQSQRVSRLYKLVSMTDVPREVTDWEPADVDAVVERLLQALWELSAEAPLARLERQAEDARRELRLYHESLKHPHFYAEGVIDDTGQGMLKAFKRLYRRDPVLSISGGPRRLRR